MKISLMVSKFILPMALIAYTGSAVAKVSDDCRELREGLSKHAPPPLFDANMLQGNIDCLQYMFDKDKLIECNKEVAIIQAQSMAERGINAQMQKSATRQEVQDFLDSGAEASSAAAGSLTADIVRLQECRAAQIQTLIVTRDAASSTDNERQNTKALKTYKKDRDKILRYMAKDNAAIEELVGESEDNLVVIEDSSELLAERDAGDFSGGDGSYVEGGSGSIEMARESQSALEDQQASYNELLEQLENDSIILDSGDV